MHILGQLRPALAPLLAVLLVVGLPAASSSGGAAARAVEDAPATRILLLGDSVTQGSAGDWTWRYRLWKHLRAVGEAADFVGPDRSLAGPSAAYADRRFDRDHAAAWGAWASAGMERVGALVADHRPDVLVVMLGINDLLYDAPAEAVLWCLEQVVLQAREIEPTVDVVLSEITQTWLTGDGRPALVNAGLGVLSDRLSTAESEVVVADAASGYRLKHTYDTSHPSAQGEVRIAAAVADALSRLGVGSPYRRPLARVGNVPRQPVVLRARAGERAVRLSWDPPPGATSFVLWRRVATPGRRWHRLGVVEGSRLRVTGLRHRHRYVFRMRARKGTATVTDVTSTVAARPRR